MSHTIIKKVLNESEMELVNEYVKEQIIEQVEVNEQINEMKKKNDARKFLSYLILPNYVYENKYNKISYKVFNDRTLEWNPIYYFSEYWYQFPEYLSYSYPIIQKVLKLITNQMLDNDCTYHREKFAVFSNLYLDMKMGETVFIKYLTIKDYEIMVDASNLEKTQII
jgi:hypothetical protein